MFHHIISNLVLGEVLFVVLDQLLKLLDLVGGELGCVLRDVLEVGTS